MDVIIYLSLIIGIAAIITVFARIVKQPPIIAYLVAGILVGPLFLNIINPAAESSELISVFAHIGVAFLLFIVGLSLDFRVLKEIGAVASFAGIAEIVVTGVIGALIAVGLGFSNIIALYIGAALAFSSTVVVVKMLSDKKEIDTLHGRIALGILIVEDFIAAIALMAIPLLNNAGSFSSIFFEVLMVLALTGIIFLVAVNLFAPLMNYLARSQETLFLFGIAWALTLAALFEWLGFSLEIGALIAGMTLSTSKYHIELGGKMKPLRDFFVVLFFVFFGSQLATQITWDLLKTSLLFSAFIVIGKPIIVMAILRIFGYRKRTNFLAGSSLAQISEFSLILILLGYNLGHIPQEIMSLGVLIAVITIGLSSYSIHYSHIIFDKISRFLFLFEGKKYHSHSSREKSYDIILLGYHRLGYKVLESIKKLDKKFVVIDYNPKVILSLGEKGIDAIYGDAADEHFLSELPLQKAKLIISTIPDEIANIAIKERLDEIKSEAVFIATIEQPRQALDLYEKGIDYVCIPHHLGGDYLAGIIEKLGLDKEKYSKLSSDHRKELWKARQDSTFEA